MFWDNTTENQVKNNPQKYIFYANWKRNGFLRRHRRRGNIHFGYVSHNHDLFDVISDCFTLLYIYRWWIAFESSIHMMNGNFTSKIGWICLHQNVKNDYLNMINICGNQTTTLTQRYKCKLAQTSANKTDALLEKLNREFGYSTRLFEYKWVSAKVLMWLTNGMLFC